MVKEVGNLEGKGFFVLRSSSHLKTLAAAAAVCDGVDLLFDRGPTCFVRGLICLLTVPAVKQDWSCVC